MIVFITILICAFLQSCATNVVYKDKDRQAGEKEGQHSTSIFIDRDGDLYPPSTVNMSGSMFTTSGETTATLRVYFEQTSNRTEWKNLLSELRITESATFSETWETVQRGLFSRTVQSIKQGADNGNRRIVFLVHGYNNEFEDAKHWYSLIEQDITNRVQERRENEPYFVRVYWDGLSQALPINIWTRAQWNGPLTGLALRRILNGLNGTLEKNAQIAMLSHSTGALVVVNAVGDGSKALDCEGSFKDHCPAVRDASSIPSLVSSVRLGLLIPAASPDTFDLFYGKQRVPQAIILGLNRQDFPTNKVAGCIWLGSTCLNVRTEQACEKLKSTFSNSTVEFAVFEFSNSSKNENQTFLFWETHGVEDQMERDRWPAFIEQVLFSGSKSETDNTIKCAQNSVET